MTFKNVLMLYGFSFFSWFNNPIELLSSWSNLRHDISMLMALSPSITKFKKKTCKPRHDINWRFFVVYFPLRSWSSIFMIKDLKFRKATVTFQETLFVNFSIFKKWNISESLQSPVLSHARMNDLTEIAQLCRSSPINLLSCYFSMGKEKDFLYIH